MLALISYGFLLGLDSFLASCGLGGISLGRARRNLLALAFGVSDAAAPLAGICIGHALTDQLARWADVAGPLVLGAFGSYVLYLAYRCHSLAVIRRNAWLILCVPISLSADNLVAGMFLSAYEYPPLTSAGIFGLTSGLMSLAGL